MALFDEMPYLEGKTVLLREMTDADAEALDELSRSASVSRYLPTYLYEQQYDDKHRAIARMREECFDTHESILLAVSLREEPGQMLGIAEIYAFDESKPKVSIGIRLLEKAWGQGIAVEAVELLKRYLIDEAGVRTITGHVMQENIASATMIAKCGFKKLYPDIWEDWGHGEPVLVDKWVYKSRWEENPDAS